MIDISFTKESVTAAIAAIQSMENLAYNVSRSFKHVNFVLPLELSNNY